MNESSYTKLSQIYDNIWQTNRPLLMKNKIVVDENPKEGDLRWGVSLIIRPEPDSELIKNLDKLNRDLKKFTGNNHLFLDQDSFHCTLKSLEGYREKIEENDLYIDNYRKRISQISFFPKLEISYKGLFASNSGIYAKGWTNNNPLKKLRHSIDKQLAGFKPKYPSPDMNRQRNTCHISTVVFKSGDLKDPQGLVKYIEMASDKSFASLSFKKMELVRYFFEGNEIKVKTITSFN